MFKILIPLLCISGFVSSQNIINGDFENSTATTFCSFNLMNDEFNAIMEDVIAFGPYSNLDILGTYCPDYGEPQSGDWFVGLSVLEAFDAFAMKLDAPLESGNVYELEFFQKKDVAYTTNPLLIGYSLSENDFGTLIDSIPGDDIEWVNHTVQFTPSLNAEYITFKAYPYQYGWNHIDNVSLTETAVSVPEFENTQIDIYPNPSSGIISLETQGAVQAIKIYNLTGEMIYQTIDIIQNPIQIDLSENSKGIYTIVFEMKDRFVADKLILE